MASLLPSPNSPRYLPAGLPPGATANPESLGLRLDRAEQIAFGMRAARRWRSTRWPSKTSTPPGRPGYWPRTISLNTLGFGPKVRRISAA